MPNQKNTNTILNQLCRLIFNEHDLQNACEEFSRLKLTGTELLSIARVHKVQTVLYSTLLKIQNQVSTPVSPELMASLERENTRSKQHLELLKNEVLSMFSAPPECLQSSRIAALKGVSTARFYSRDCLRWMRDIDLYVDTPSGAFALHEWFLKRGFDIDPQELPWFKLACPGKFDPQQMYGQMFLQKTYDSDFARVDIHYNRYSVGYAGYLDYDLLDKAEVYYQDDIPIPVLSAEACMVLLFAHMPSMGYVAIKDINDVAAITSQVALDFDIIASALNRSCLVPQAIKTAEVMLQLYDYEPIARQATDLLKSLPVREKKSFWMEHSRNWRHRALVNAYYSFEFERSFIRSSLPKSAVVAAQCCIYYLQRFSPRTGSKTIVERLIGYTQPDFDLLNYRLDRRICVHFVPYTPFRAQPVNWTNPAFQKRVKALLPDIQLRAYGNLFMCLVKGTAKFALTESFLFVCTTDLLTELETADSGAMISNLIQEILIDTRIANVSAQP
jgi:hypothetical protein